jgi:RimJ/RimL family protein N-acetyltransferase
LRIARRYPVRARDVTITGMIEHVETPRLRGEPLGPRHLDLMAPLFADARVGATMGGVMDRETVAGMLRAAQQKWASDGFAYWIFFERTSGEVIARGGLSRTVFDGTPEVEVGWATFPERWGEGFATEVGQAALDAAFGPLGLSDVVAFTLPHNGASRRVMEKLGFTYEKTAPYKVFGDHVLYRRVCTQGDTRE